MTALIDINSLNTKFEQYKDWNKCRFNIITDLNKECGNMTDYSGRVIYELLQNADDAEAKKVQIDWKPNENTIVVRNDGGKPFTEKGFMAIIYSSMSTKQGDENTIGTKGIGFRSVLNWAEDLHIYSNNVHLQFSENIAEGKWSEIKQEWFKITGINIEEVNNHIDECQRVAMQLDRKCPIPIMSVPKILEGKEVDNWTTAIAIKYKDEVRSQIEEQINGLSERILVFLRNINCIEIKDLKQFTTTLHEDKCKTSIFDDFELNEFNLNDTQWYKISRGKMAMAFSLKENIEISTNYLYSYFPTLICVGLPCLVQAEFELIQSREGLQHNDHNRELQIELAGFLLEAAEIVAREKLYGGDLWLPLKLVSPISSEYANSQIKDLLDSLRKALPQKKLYPTVDCDFYQERETYYYSEELSEFIQKNNLDKLMPQIQYPERPKTLETNNRMDYENLKNCVENVATCIKGDISKLSEFVKIWHSINSNCYNRNNPLPILIDEKGNIIKDRVLIKKGNIDEVHFPNNVEPRWLHADLQNRLKPLTDNMYDSAGIWERSLAKTLSRICETRYYDKSTVLVEIAPTSKNLPAEEIKDRVSCLLKSWNTLADSDTNFSNIYLLNAEGMPCAINELIDTQNPNIKKIYPDETLIPTRYRLLNYKEWNLDLVDANVEPTKFFEKLFGGTKYVPIISDVNIGYINNQFPNDGSFTRTDKTNPQSKNKRVIVPSDFYENLSREQLLAGLMLDSTMNKEVISPAPLTYFYQSERTAKVERSCMAYVLDKQSTHRIGTYLIEDNIFIDSFQQLDIDLLQNAYGIDIKELRYFLIKLGAKQNISELSVEKLHEIIRNMNQLRDCKIQTWYKKIKEAIQKKDSNFKYEGPEYKLYAKKGGRKLWFNNTEVYYNNNQCLPSRIQDDFAMLDMPLRAGEADIARIFGVKLTSSIIFELDNSSSKKNENLSLRFGRRIQERMLDIMLYLNKGNVNQATLKSYFANLKKLDIEFYKQCECYEKCSSAKIVLKPGEFIFADGKYCLVCDKETIESLLLDYKVLASISEAICMKLKLSSDETFEKVLDILRNEDSWNIVKRKSEYSEDDISNIMNLISGDAESDKKQDDSITTRLQEVEEKEKKRLEEKEGKYSKICSWLYQQVKNKNELHKDYTKYTRKLAINDWKGDSYISFAKNVLNDYDVDVDSIEDYVSCEEEEIKILPIYQVLISRYEDSLDSEMKSKLLFEGHLKELESYIEDIKKADLKRDESLEEITISKICPDQNQYEQKFRQYINKESSRQTARNRISNKEKRQLGAIAEKVAFEYLKENYKCAYVKKISELSNELSGSDNMHYDIEYKINGNDHCRFLEVKWFGNGSFHMSRAEYEFGQENKDYYDIALVSQTDDNKYSVTIFECPFKIDSKNYIQPEPSDFMVYMGQK